MRGSRTSGNPPSLRPSFLPCLPCQEACFFFASDRRIRFLLISPIMQVKKLWRWRPVVSAAGGHDDPPETSVAVEAFLKGLSVRLGLGEDNPGLRVRCVDVLVCVMSCVYVLLVAHNLARRLTESHFHVRTGTGAQSMSGNSRSCCSL